jgi:hypothetical protein
VDPGSHRDHAHHPQSLLRPFRLWLSDLYIVLEEEEPVTGQQQDPDQLQLTRARFAQAAILRMLPFVDAIAASSLASASASAGGDINLAGASGAPVAPTERLQALLNVRDASSNASSRYPAMAAFGILCRSGAEKR